MFQSTTLAATAYRCQPWCTDHYTGAQPEDGYCRRPAGTICLSDTDNGPMVLAYQQIGDELDLNQAEAYALALLDLVASARTAVAA